MNHKKTGEISEKLKHIEKILEVYKPSFFMDFAMPPIYTRINFSELKTRWKEYLTLSRGTEQVDLYIHIPFCMSRCRYCQCQSAELGNPNILAGYLDYLKQAVLYFEDTFKNTEFCNVYVGGGTPNLFSAAQMRELLRFIFSKLRLKEGNYERTYEMHPLFADKEKLKIAREAGFNRLSFGIQTFKKSTLEKEGREYVSPELLDSLVAYAKQLRFMDINVDFILGLSGETEEDALENLRTILKIRPTSLTFFTLQFETEAGLMHLGINANFYKKIREVDRKLYAEARKEGYLGSPDDQPIELEFNMNLPMAEQFLSNYEGLFATKKRSIFGIGHYAAGSITTFNKYEIQPMGSDRLGCPATIGSSWLMQFDAVSKVVNWINTEPRFKMWQFMRLSLLNNLISDPEFFTNFNQDVNSAFHDEIAYLLEAGLLRLSGKDYIFSGTDVSEKLLCCLLFLDIERLRHMSLMGNSS